MIVFTIELNKQSVTFISQWFLLNSPRAPDGIVARMMVGNIITLALPSIMTELVLHIPCYYSGPSFAY